MRLIGAFYLFFIFFTPILCAETTTESDPLYLDWLDRSTKPEDSFYQFANGSWQKKNPIPPQYASWGTFYILHEKVQKLIHQILIDASTHPSEKNSMKQKVGDFYFSGMNEHLINKLGVAPLQQEFTRIASIKNTTDLQAEIAHLHAIGVNVCFDFSSMQDFKNSDEMIGAAMQGGLGLPDRDYYLKDDAKFKHIRDAYLKHVAAVFRLLGDDSRLAEKEANLVMTIETNLARSSLSQIEQRDPHAIYHIKTMDELQKEMPHFSWQSYFKTMGYPTISHINLAMPVFFKNLDGLLQKVSLADWKVYLRWHLIDAFSSYLSSPFEQERFKMSAEITGTKKMLPRWQRVVAVENGALGFAIGKIYVEKYFPPSSKQAVLDIVHHIREVLKHDIGRLTWMSPDTKKAALAKLALMGERVGYPSKWWDYSSLSIDRGAYVLNVIRANQFLVKRDLDKIGKPIDRTEWVMTPQTVNAYYDPSMNNINFPAGILQAPFFDPQAPAAINYGGIGFIIGHEMTHGFDDQGAQFDGHGNLKNWWSPKDLQKFHEATACIIKQFSQYKVEGGYNVQGQLVVGEATADLGGLILAYRAFQQSKAYQSAKTISGYTKDMQFFIGAAHSWAINMRQEQLQNQVTIDPHPPAEFRVNGTLANMKEFQDAFSIPNASPMVKKERCVIW